MNAIRIAARELLGLVVDDWRFALAILAWLAIIWLVTPELDIAGPARGILLFTGLGMILVESSWRQARRRARRSATR